MIDCNELIETLGAEARDHVHLALIGQAPPAAEMHLDIAFFSEAQLRVAEALCDD